VSASLVKNGYCDVRNFAIFTDVPKSLDWIDQSVRILEGKYMQFSAVNSRFSDQPSQQRFQPKKQPAACGVMRGNSDDYQWPWAAKIFRENSKARNFAIGTIISNRHIFTQPSMLSYLKSDGFTLPLIYDLAVVVDLYNALAKPNHIGVEDMIIHPNFKASVPRLANIAILKLDQVLQFNEGISPICLWEYSFNIESIAKQQIVATGYKQLAKKTFDKNALPLWQQLNIPVKAFHRNDCSFNIKFVFTSLQNSNTYFCNRMQSGTSCIDDDTVYLNHHNVWYLFATEVYQEILHNVIQCSDASSSIYEGFEFYIDWIKNVLKS